jgi:hypothetical protein
VAPAAPGEAVAPQEPGTTALHGPAPVSPRPRPRRSRRPAIALTALAALVAGVTVIALALHSPPGRPAASPAVSSRSAGHPARSPTASGASPSARSSASASGPGYGALPAGYYRFTNSTGFSIGVPHGWPISHVGHYVYITDPANSGIFLLIDQSDTPRPDPLADWRQQAANRASSFPDYHLIRLDSVSYPQAEKAADWEFTYVRDGILVHILNRNVLANRHHAYALYWSVPESDWTSYYHVFQAFAATFRPAP